MKLPVTTNIPPGATVISGAGSIGSAGVVKTNSPVTTNVSNTYKSPASKLIDGAVTYPYISTSLLIPLVPEVASVHVVPADQSPV